MTSGKGPSHVVVDGSNIATEGRSLPSLAQLSEAVMSFMEEHPNAAITVVVDATFGHRIDKKEVKEFEEGISNNELVAPPAGAVGRGDAFVLAIAQKSNASILSNDSFQEFHADYEWLFDEGRLIGGKPVPHVGWVFVDRVPVRGPVSRKATGSKGGSRRGARKDDVESERRSGRKASDAASQPMPVPKTPPPGRSRKPAAPDVEAAAVAPAAQRPSVPKAGETVNDLMPFLEFVEHHPVGTSVNGTVESYSSHGAYISIGENGVRGYVPLRLMADPAPPSARKVMKLGESVTVVVVSFAPLRRSIDCAVPDMAQAAIAAAREEQAEEHAAQASAAPKRRPASTTAAKKPATKKAAANEPAAEPSVAPTAPAKKPARRRPRQRRRPSKQGPGEEGSRQEGSGRRRPPPRRLRRRRLRRRRLRRRRLRPSRPQRRRLRRRRPRPRRPRRRRLLPGRPRRRLLPGRPRRRRLLLARAHRRRERTAADIRVVTWNINSLRARQERVEEWLGEVQPDVLLLQETKLADDAFPALSFEALGYSSAHHGQGQWNGVAILSKVGIDDVVAELRRRRRARSRRPDHHRHVRWCARRAASTCRTADRSTTTTTRTSCRGSIGSWPTSTPTPTRARP